MRSIIEILAWSMAAAVIGWRLAMSRASVALRNLRARMQDEIERLQDDAERARARAAQLAREMASWSAGCRQGREDVIAILPLLMSEHERLAGMSPAAANSEGRS
ncbi:MAG: hypothetical protein ACLQDY_25500 [Streptosporangiaceae bacterium]